MPNNVLIIYEGARTEKRFIENHFKTLGRLGAYTPFCYGCNIYNFYDLLVRNSNGSDFEYIDVLAILKGCDGVPSQADISIFQDNAFTDIFLVFDLDNHDNTHSQEEKEAILLKMAAKFKESTDGGLLLINSPMVESYRDINREKLPIIELNDRIPVADSGKYKTIVGKRGFTKGISQYSEKTFHALARIHFEEIASILGLPKESNSLNEIDTERLLITTFDQANANGLLPIYNEMVLLAYIISFVRIEDALETPLDQGTFEKGIR